MKNVFLTNKLVKTLTIILVFMTIFYFAMPHYVSAASLSLGGILLEPVKDLLLLIGDGTMLILNKVLYGIDDSLITIDNGGVWKGLALFLGAAVAIALILAPVTIGVGAAILAGVATAGLSASYMPDSFYLPYFTVSPQEIFANQIYFLDVNFFNPNEYETKESPQAENTENDEESIKNKSTAAILKEFISNWYYTILIISAAGFMCILLYIAFKILITVNTEEKAKYKERIKDWVVGLCLLGTMHYIMVFSTSIVQAIINGLAENNLEVVVVKIPRKGMTPENEDYIRQYVGRDVITTKEGDLPLFEGDKETGVINYPTTLLGQARLEAQLGEAAYSYQESQEEARPNTDVAFRWW